MEVVWWQGVGVGKGQGVKVAHLRVGVGDEPVDEGAIISPTGKELLVVGVPGSTGYITVVPPVGC